MQGSQYHAGQPVPCRGTEVTTRVIQLYTTALHRPPHHSYALALHSPSAAIIPGFRCLGSHPSHVQSSRQGQLVLVCMVVACSDKWPHATALVFLGKGTSLLGLDARTSARDMPSKGSLGGPEGAGGLP